MIESLGFFAGKVLCCRLPKMPWNRTERKTTESTKKSSHSGCSSRPKSVTTTVRRQQQQATSSWWEFNVLRELFERFIFQPFFSSFGLFASGASNRRRPRIDANFWCSSNLLCPMKCSMTSSPFAIKMNFFILKWTLERFFCGEVFGLMLCDHSPSLCSFMNNLGSRGEQQQNCRL